MSAAVVNITCPRCGGDVQGVDRRLQPQTLPCPYCRMELHVPRVGEHVVRERVVHERVVVRDAEPAPQIARLYSASPRSVLWSSLVAGIAFLFVMIFIVSQQTEAEHTVDRLHERDTTEKRCVAACTPKCATLSLRSTGDRELDATLQSADKTVCETDCSVGCMHLERR